MSPPTPPPASDGLPALLQSSSRDKLRAAVSLDQKLNSDSLGDPNLRPFPLPRKAEPIRAGANSEAVEAPSQEEPARRLLELDDLEDFFRELLERCVSEPRRPQGSEDPAPAPSRGEGELPDRFQEDYVGLPPGARFRKKRLRLPWRCSFCHVASSKMDDADFASQWKYSDRWGADCCQNCLERAEKGEAPQAEEASDDPWDSWDAAEFRRRADAHELRVPREGKELAALEFGGTAYQEPVPLKALTEEEAARADEPLPRRRRCTEERRDQLFRRLAVPFFDRRKPVEERHMSEEKVEARYQAGLRAYAAFVSSSKAAVAELRAAARCGEERPVAKREAREPEQRGWASLAAAAFRDKKSRTLPEDQRRERARSLGVRDEFFESLEKSAQALQALAESEAGATSRPCQAREIAEEVSELLQAPSKAEKLAEAMAAADKPIYARALGLPEMGGSGVSLFKLCGLFVEASAGIARGGPFGYYAFGRAGKCPFRKLRTAGPGAAYPKDGVWFHPWRDVGIAVDPGDLKPKRKAALAETLSAKGPANIYRDAMSRAYDSSVDKQLFWSMRQVDCFRRIFRLSANAWDALLEEDKEQDSGGGHPGAGSGGPGSRPGQDARSGAGADERPPPPGPKVPEKFYGVRLGDVRQLVESHRAWFEEERWCKFSQRNRKKTMYDVCPELIIPATTCQERIVTLQAEDLEKLRSRFDDPPGILYSQSDLTIDPSLGTVRLGGVEVPAGLTLHGKLVRGGPIRQKYWNLGPERDSQWRTLPCHGRDERPVKEVAPIPMALLYAGGGPLGEASDRVWRASELQEGDTVVLRRGVSYIDMVAGDGPHHALDSFASHFWGEETVDFLRTLVRHAEALEAQGGVKASDRTYYICTFNNNQHRVELGSSWRTSPFNRALEFVAGMSQLDTRNPRDAVMVFDSEAKPLQRKWCVFEAWRCTELDLPLRLYCPDGEITRNSAKRSKTAQEVLKMVAEIDVATAGCSVKADADMIDRAIEDAPGGFAAVHAKLRTRVLDLMTFIGSLAVSIDPMTGQKVEEIELQVRGNSPAAVKGRMLPAREIAGDMCGGGGDLGRNVLLVAPAGSGKSVFSRALVRHAVEANRANASEQELLPVRVPLAELAKTVKRIRGQAKMLQKKLSVQLVRKKMSQQEFEKRLATLDQPDFSGIFDAWAQKAFLRDAGDVTADKDGRQRLLILDGFDEAGESRAEIISWLRTYVHKHQALRTLLTTRPSGLDGVGMSTGRVRAVRRGQIQHVDVQAGLVSISEPYPVGTMLELQCEDESDTEANAASEVRSRRSGTTHDNVQGVGQDGFVQCSVESAVFVLPLSSVLEKIRPGWSVLKAQGDQLALDYAYCLKRQTLEGDFEVELLPADGGSSAGVARGVLEVQDEAAVTGRIRKMKEAKQLDPDYQAGIHDAVSVTVTKSAEGHKVGGFVRIPKEALSPIRHELPAVVEQLKAVKQALAVLARGEDKQRNDLEAEKLQLERLKGRLERTRGEGQDIILKVMEDLRYIRLKGPRGIKDVPLARLKTNGQTREMLIRSQLVRELGFSDFEIDTIDGDAAAAIARNVGGDALAGFQREMLDRFAPNLWDRPLMANLFGQYLRTAGVQRTLELSSAVAELEIFRFITEKLIRQAAAVVAPNNREETVAEERARIYDILMETSRQKMNRNERLWHKANLRHLYEDAIRGHFRLFEPQEGSEKSRPVQFYHYRIQELLAAEAWNKQGLPIESASRIMVQKDALVSTGLAPLKFLVQARLSQQQDSEKLVLDFCDEGEHGNGSLCDSRLVTTAQQWLPPALDLLQLKFPALQSGRSGGNVKLDAAPLDSSFKAALPGVLRVCKLDFQACKITDQGLRWLGLNRLELLETLELKMNNCGEVSELGLTMIAASCPRSVKTLNLEAKACQPQSNIKVALQGKSGLTGEYLLAGFTQDAAGDFRPFFAKESEPAGCICCGDRWSLYEGKDPSSGELVASSEGTAEDAGPQHWLPPGKLELRKDSSSVAGGELEVRKLSEAPRLRAFGKALPADLCTLSLDLSSTSVSDASLEGLSADLPRRLCEFSLKVQSCKSIRSGGLTGLCEHLPPSLKQLRLDFRRSLLVDGVGALGRSLPRTLELFELVCNRRVGDQDAQSLGEGLPPSLQHLSLDFRRSPLTDDGLAALGRSLPRGLVSLTLSCELCRKLMAGAGAVCRELPGSLQKLALDFETCRLLTEDSLEELGANLPANLRALILDVSSCSRFGDRGLKGICARLPASLRTLRLRVAGSARVHDEGLLGVGEGLPGGLEELHLDCSRCVSLTAAGVAGLCRKLPGGLRSLALQLGWCQELDDKVLDLELPSGILSMTLDLSHCTEMSDEGLGTFAARLPPPGPAGGATQSLDLHFLSCGKVTSSGLKALQSAVTPSPELLPVNFTRKSLSGRRPVAAPGV